MSSTYRRLDPDRIIATIGKLNQRIKERFPHASLNEVCAELYDIAMESRDKAEWISSPNVPLRAAVAVVIVLSLAALAYSVSLLDLSLKSFYIGDLLQIADAGLNNLILIGAAVFFLVTMEARIKRKRALEALHELRAMAHVIDMHQLTKDPGRQARNATPSSPEVKLTRFELVRYLDYCSEMFSLIGKVAAVYAEDFADPPVLSAANEIEALTTGLSRKVWQKIMIVKGWEATDPGPARPPAGPALP